MQVKPDRLAADLERHGLRPVYLVFGDEPQQLLESTDAIRAAARGTGAEERIVFDVETGFDWSQIGTAAGSMSLFATRRLIEIRLGSTKPDKKGADVLVELVASLHADDTLLVTADKLDRTVQKKPWFKALDEAGVVVQARQLQLKALKPWLMARAGRHGKTLSDEAAELIAARVEGNLLAAAQEVEKLCLVVDEECIDVDRIISAVTDSSRFDVFALVDSAVTGDVRRTLRILRGLRAEGTEAVIIGWAINRELRSLSRMAADIERGEPMEDIFARHRVWKSRAGATRGALRRHRLQDLVAMLRRSALVDRMIKGSAAGNAWDELEQLCIRLAGVDALPAIVSV
jgi:DNA polymerase-3 subunit delta